MRVAVDVCVGHRGIALLRNEGHEVVAIADEGERDDTWFRRAMRLGAEAVISTDTDIEILCYDANIKFFRALQGVKGHVNARRFAVEYREPPAVEEHW